MAKSLLIDGAHLGRLMKLCRTLSGNSGVQLAKIQQKLHTSRRTVFRDLKELDAAGIQVEIGTHGYFIRGKLSDCQKAIANATIGAAQAVINSSLS